MRRTWISPLIAASAVMWTSLTASAADAAALRGEKVVEEWCRTCHLQAGDPPDPDMAPAYEDIVRWPGRDRAYLKRFLDEDHFPMTTFRLFDSEKADVLAWLMSLKRKD